MSVKCSESATAISQKPVFNAIGTCSCVQAPLTKFQSKLKISVLDVVMAPVQSSESSKKILSFARRPVVLWWFIRFLSSGEGWKEASHEMVIAGASPSAGGTSSFLLVAQADFLDFLAEVSKRRFRRRHLTQDAVSCAHHGWFCLIGVSDSRRNCRLASLEPCARPGVDAPRRTASVRSLAKMPGWAPFFCTTPPRRNTIRSVNP